MAGVIAHAKLPLDQVCYPAAGPQWSLVAEFLGTFQQPRYQLRPLFFIQLRLAARAAGRLKSDITFGGNGSGPTAHSLAADLDATAHFALVVTLPQELQSLETPPLQRLEVASHTTRIAHIAKTLLSDRWLRYIMRDSVCAGINRQVVGNERVLQERRERIHLGLESCGRRREVSVEA
jgi:hypothetical protein